MKSREEYDIETALRVMKMYENHELRGVRTDGEELNAWLLMRPQCSMFWAEVVSITGGRILVHGDHNPVLFTFYNGEPLKLLKVIERSGLGYLSEKASNCNGSFKAQRLDEEVLDYEVRELLDESCLEEDEYEKLPPEEATILRDFIEYDLNWDATMHELANVCDMEGYTNVGMVYEVSLYQAREIVRQLVRLLKI